MNPKAFATALSLLAFCCALAPVYCFGQFLRTGERVYQSLSHPGVKLINSEAGIFIMNGEETDLQVFNPKNIVDESSNHIFLRFDEKSNRYNELHVGDKRYTVKGSFTMNLGVVRVTVDNNNPYCSVVVDEPGQTPEILGLLGTKVIVDAMGNTFVALLEANQFNEYISAIRPYVVKKDKNSHQVYLRGKPLSTDNIGLALEQHKNPCLDKRAAILTEGEIVAIQDIPGRAQRKEQLQKLLDKKGLRELKDLLLLRVTKRTIVGFAPETEEVRIIRPLQVDSGARRICTIENLEL